MALRVEWPTVGLIVLVYGLWFGILLGSPWLGSFLSTTLLIPVLVLHSSLQHECLHGHPFRQQWLNDLMVLPGLGVFLPYGRFATTHRAHHATPHLTDPFTDPESHYVHRSDWDRMSKTRRWLLACNRCLLGRMILGPPLFFFSLAAKDWRAIVAGDRAILADWIRHLTGVVMIGAVVLLVSTVPLVLYLLACWAALSILAIRTFLEHQAQGPISERSVIIERGGLLGFLFLNNHLHAVHHARPAVAWYHLPALYRRHRPAFLARNGGYAYPSYRSVFRAYFLKPKEPAIHPSLDA